MSKQLEKIEADIQELFDRSNLLLKSLEESAATMEVLVTNQKNLTTAQEYLAATLKQMTH